MNQEFIDYYELFGLTKDSTEEDLDFNYKEIVNFMKPESHPEKTYSKEEILYVQEQLDIINDAYRTLKDPKLRKEYNKRYLEYKYPKKEEVKEEQLEPVIITRRNPVQEERISREKVQKKTFFQNVKDSYREVRRDEKKYSFKKRHARINDAYDETFADSVKNVPGEILFYTGKGTAHVFLEGLYQLSRLSYINKDTVTKYVIRNRRLIAAALAVGVIASCGWNKEEKKVEELPVAPIVTELPTEKEEMKQPVAESEEPRVVMTRFYTIERGDTLSRLAYNANSSVEELKRMNGYEDDKIYSGRKMTIPYTIDREDLEYYTESIKVYDLTLEEIARAYETDIDTLYQLNREAIYKLGRQYSILSDSLLVPKFPTKTEVQEQKQIKTGSYE